MTQTGSDTVSPFSDVQGREESEYSERLDALEGARIALFSNTKKNSDYFLEGVGVYLEAEYGADVSDVVYKDVASSGAPDELLDSLTDYDAVLTAYGDCGSCSSWTIRDAIELENRGVPTVVFCSDSFSTLCQYETKNQGYPGLPVVEFEHPIANLNASVVVEERVTEDICTEVAEALTLSIDDIVDRYTDRYID